MYLLDSDVFIQAKNRHYGFDIVPAWWDWLEQAHRAGRVFTVEACRNEVVAAGDELADWMAARPPAFSIKPRPRDQPSLRRVAEWAAGPSQYRQGAISEFLAAADYFLVSQALSLGYAVVTHEEPAPLANKRIKIPDACNAVQVSWMPPWRMLRAEGAQFHLRQVSSTLPPSRAQTS
jgi:hypothetical protein